MRIGICNENENVNGNVTVTTYLEAVLKSVGVYFVKSCLESVGYEFLDLRKDVAVEVEVELGLLRADDFGKVLKAHFVSVLKLSVVFCLLLYRVISQMYAQV